MPRPSRTDRANATLARMDRAGLSGCTPSTPRLAKVNEADFQMPRDESPLTESYRTRYTIVRHVHRKTGRDYFQPWNRHGALTLPLPDRAAATQVIDAIADLLEEGATYDDVRTVASEFGVTMRVPQDFALGHLGDSAAPRCRWCATTLTVTPASATCGYCGQAA